MTQAALDLNLSLKRTRKREFLEQMERVVPWAALVALIAPYYPEGRTGRPPFALETMLRTHFLQQWFSLSDPAMEEAFFDVPLYREFAWLDAHGRLPDESTILRFRHRLEKYKLAKGILATANDLLRSQALAAQAGQRRGRYAHCRAKFDEEQGGQARPRDAFEQGGQPVALWDEGAHWRGC